MATSWFFFSTHMQRCTDKRTSSLVFKNTYWENNKYNLLPVCTIWCSDGYDHKVYALLETYAVIWNEQDHNPKKPIICTYVQSLFLFQLNAHNTLNKYICHQPPPKCFGVCYTIFRETTSLLTQKIVCFLQRCYKMYNTPFFFLNL